LSDTISFRWAVRDSVRVFSVDLPLQARPRVGKDVQVDNSFTALKESKLLDGSSKCVGRLRLDCNRGIRKRPTLRLNKHTVNGQSFFCHFWLLQGLVSCFADQSLVVVLVVGYSVEVDCVLHFGTGSQSVVVYKILNIINFRLH